MARSVLATPAFLEDLPMYPRNFGHVPPASAGKALYTPPGGRFTGRAEVLAGVSIRFKKKQALPLYWQARAAIKRKAK
ncbi:hypothetical protein [Ottowia testudinis]|uniref:Uncharacterized protein n=1 Tax=Ottowia testudinis TaxID=2816950 RepID=A0A975CG09_9BURK|nr:hypothetical protein [Ottowia testudinis]QTD45758.1 hypothetical protein J1M35_02230 [Ottowia testudinis]